MTDPKTPAYTYIIYIAKIYSIPVFDPLVRYLKMVYRPYRFYIADKVKENFPEDWDRSLILNSLKEARAFNADFILVSGNFVDFRIPGIKVQLFHGLGIEKEVHYKIRHFFDVYLTSGPYVTRRFEDLAVKYKYFLVRETGWPKIDYILNYDAANIRQKLGLPKEKKIILYAPTFSTKHQSASALFQTIPRILKEDEFLVCKFHELMDSEMISEYKNIPQSNIKVLGNIEITPYLHASDIMISDTSSVVYEFMALHKPVITYRASGNTQKAFNIEHAGDLRVAIDYCMINNKVVLERQDRFLKEVNPVLDGSVSQRIFKVLDEIASSKALDGKRKPLNLVRKLQIIYHGVFRKGYLR